MWLGGRCAVGWGGRRTRSLVGQRVQECKWSSAKPADKTEQKPTRTSFSKMEKIHKFAK